MRKKLSRLSQDGQMTLEMLLIIVALLGVAMTISKTAQSEKWMESLISGPWKPLQAMIEDGTWIVENSKGYNPGMTARHGTFKGDSVP
jgi:hypothetical protein